MVHGCNAVHNLGKKSYVTSDIAPQRRYFLAK